jgi:hypothetical protein
MKNRVFGIAAMCMISGVVSGFGQERGGTFTTNGNGGIVDAPHVAARRGRIRLRPGMRAAEPC